MSSWLPLIKIAVPLWNNENKVCKSNSDFIKTSPQFINFTASLTFNIIPLSDVQQWDGYILINMCQNITNS